MDTSYLSPIAHLQGLVVAEIGGVHGENHTRWEEKMKVLRKITWQPPPLTIISKASALSAIK